MAPMVTLVGKTWDLQVVDVLRTTTDENLAMIAESVRWLVDEGRRVVFDAEHFFDGHISDPDYALRCLDAAVSAGAERVTLCDTRGGTLPDQVETMVRDITARFGSIAGIHCHDDSGCAVANTLAAVRAGAVQVQGCINGYGERTGNANLCTLIPNLQIKMGIRVIDDEQLARLTEVARDVAEIANISPPLSAPYIGQSAFTHKGGQHIDAMSKASYAYQHIDPARVGNRRHSVITQQSGRGTVHREGGGVRRRSDAGPGARAARRRRGEATRAHRPFVRGRRSVVRTARAPRARQRRTVHAHRLHRARRTARGPFAGVRGDHQGAGRRCGGAHRRGGQRPGERARRGVAQSAHAELPGDRRNATLRLQGARARRPRRHRRGVRVLVESGDHHRRWSTVGCSTNIIEASWSALADAFEYAIIAARESGQALRASTWR